MSFLAAFVTPYFVGALALSSFAAVAQSVPRAVVVEHFTNTRCSICRNRNPGFYANLRQQPAPTLHIAYHPSSPYSACVFSQQNPTENDARTNYYGIYGATPRLVVNGTVIPAAQDYAAPAVFAPAQGQTAPFTVEVALLPAGPDSLCATVRLTTVAAHAYATLDLYLPLVEDTVFYAAPNGEVQHFDVFRQSFTGTGPLAITPGATVGDVVTSRRTLGRSAPWNLPRLYAVALVQETNHALVQAGASARFGAGPTGLPAAPGFTPLALFPNPASTTLQVAGGAAVRQLTIYNALGQVVRTHSGPVEVLRIADLPAGAYVLRFLTTSGQRRTLRFVK